MTVEYIAGNPGKIKARRDAAIARDYARGLSGPELAARYGLTPARVYQIVAAQGVELRAPSGRYYTEAEDLAIREHALRGLPWFRLQLPGRSYRSIWGYAVQIGAHRPVRRAGATT